MTFFWHFSHDNSKSIGPNHFIFGHNVPDTSLYCPTQNQFFWIKFGHSVTTFMLKKRVKINIFFSKWRHFFSIYPKFTILGRTVAILILSKNLFYFFFTDASGPLNHGWRGDTFFLHALLYLYISINIYVFLKKKKFFLILQYWINNV